METIKDKIIVELIEEENLTATIHTTGVRVRSNKGKVIAKGQLATEVKAGDVVYFSPNAGLEISYDGRKCVAMRQDDVYGKN